jgi:Tim44-like domain
MKWISVVFLTVLLVVSAVITSSLWVNSAQARPGGGHSSSGHHSSSRSSSSRSSSWHSSSSGRSSWGHSSSGGGGNAGESSVWFWLVLLLIIVVIIVVLANNSPPVTLSSKPNKAIRDRQATALNQALVSLQAGDPNFSKILLMDFVHLLFSKLYHYAGQAEFSYLTPFLGAELLQQAHFFNQHAAQEVVINGIHWETIYQDGEQDSIGLLIDANYTLIQHGKHSRYAVTERWLLCRQAGLVSPEPNKMQALCCPHCAAPAHFNDAGECPYCKTTLHKGEAQWYVQRRVVTKTTPIESANLVSYAQEQGTELATVKQDDLVAQIWRMQQLHGFTVWNDYFAGFQAQIIEPTFLAIYQHWSARNWEGVRHLLSDRLYEANQFWTDRYKQHNWFNRLANLKIQRVVLARLEVDRFYEAITVRIFASCYDYTEDAQGKLIGGSKRQLREYSEYWTFVRRTGLLHSTGEFGLNQCPQCGAAADKMGQAAECGYCGSKISTGEFSWVLFLIMQDDVYRG